MSEGNNKMFPIWLITIAVVIASSIALTQAQPEANFRCLTENATCRSITEYTNPNTTTLKEITTLFGIKHYLDFLGANNLPTNTQNNYKVSPNTVIKVPFPCKCNNGTGKSNHVPKYKIKPGDTLDDIARTRFNALVKYQQIQTANKIVDANNITAGDTIWIPLPCSCDKVDGNSVMHYAHIVESGSSIPSIAQEYGTTQQSLLTINGIKDPNSLQAGQVLDVPLPDSCSRTVCDYTGYTSSNISTAIVTQNTCAVAPSGGGGNSDSGATKSILNKLLVLIHFLLFFVYLL
ncbi:hypothetical protein TSUD_66830 [Trifolium subterraneum]|uniref:LysM domain-containing protein n=1 Tax=Trifolium subterraneum TaxID=3900 RepID=A0A2Z6MN64_TRISU|nr:hypothetical protein TSUD_66830 [Trifolium subterraneum]